MSYVVGGVELGKVITAIDAGAGAGTEPTPSVVGGSSAFVPGLLQFRPGSPEFDMMMRRNQRINEAGGGAASGGAAGGGAAGGGAAGGGAGGGVTDALMAQGAALLQRLGMLAASFSPSDYAGTLAAFRASIGLPASGPTTQADLDAMAQALARLDGGKESSGLPGWVLPAVAVGAFLLLRRK